MYETILVPLDGSELAEGVLPYIEELARRFESELVLMQAVTVPVPLVGETAPGLMTSPAAAEATAKIVQKEMEAEIKLARRYLGSVGRRLRRRGIKVRTDVMEGGAGAAILQCAEEVAASLIAMSTHGRGGLGRLVFGSTADEVARNSPVPVFLVRPHAGDGQEG